MYQGTVLIKTADELMNYSQGEETQVEQVINLDRQGWPNTKIFMLTDATVRPIVHSSGLCCHLKRARKISTQLTMSAFGFLQPLAEATVA
jgi:hypothetical protein